MWWRSWKRFELVATRLNDGISSEILWTAFCGGAQQNAECVLTLLYCVVKTLTNELATASKIQTPKDERQQDKSNNL